MNEPHDPNETFDVSSAAANSLDAGLAAGFGKRVDGPASVLSALGATLGSLRPVLLKEAQGESALVVKPASDAMPSKAETGDRYQLSGEIARGGMGAVLRGRDVDLGRDLAVKVLLENYADRPEVARRFIEEAQIGGQLQHPGVVPVYDIGRFGDRPFFTMKLVKGQTLSALLTERTEAGADRPRLLGIALQVAQTLAYAHAKGVIHRDLKPANIMVGAFGEVQVMDWGLAKVLAEGGIADEEKASRQHQPVEGTLIRTARSTGSGFGTDTEAGSMLGTPAYMPPEQANGDVALMDRRADVFGLGAILCEILTGKAPYVGRSPEEVRRKAANGDLGDAMARLDGCGADHELIALTKACLAPEAIDRPKDAQAVAEGLTAYLDGVQERLHQAELAHAAEVARTEEAQATAAQERRAREVAQAYALAERRSRRLTLALASTVLVAILLGGAGWLWVKNDRDARQIALTREVNDALSKATVFRAQASTAATGSAAQFARAREQAQRALALVESGPADATLKIQVARLQTELDEEERDRRLVAALDAARLAQAETVVGESRFAIERAVPLFREAFRAYGLPAGEGAPGAAAERIRQRPAAVREAMIAALDEWTDLAGNPVYMVNEPNLDWLRAVLTTAEPADDWTKEFRAALAEKDAANRRKSLEKLAAEVDVRKHSPQTLTRLAMRVNDVDLAGAGLGYATGEGALALLRRGQRQYPADFWINEILGLGLNRADATPAQNDEAVRFLTAAVALRPESPGTRLNLGNALRTGQPDEAIVCFRKAIELDPKYAGAHVNLGLALFNKGQPDEAITCYRTAIELDQKLAVARRNLGDALERKGQVDEAIACYRVAIELDPKDAFANNNLGLILCDVKRDFDAAIVCFRKAVELDPKFAMAQSNLAVALEGKGQLDEAIACCRKAIELDPKYAGAHDHLGIALAGKGQLDEAIVSFRKASELSAKYARAHNNLGVALAREGELDEGIVSYRKAIEVDPKYAAAHSNLGNALRAKGRVDEAIAEWHKAIELDPNFAEAHYGLGAALCDVKGDYDRAIVCFRKAIELDPKVAIAHSSLGLALQRKGQLDEAIASWRRGAELGDESARASLAQAERQAAARDRFADFKNGRYTPATVTEHLGLAEWCQIKKLHQAATRQYADAIAGDPRLADDLIAGHRYNAACNAALAAAGQGDDAAKLDDKERRRLRQQGLDWLKADLAAWGNRLDSSPSQNRPAIVQTLSHWQKDTDLAGLRDAAALAKLPSDEQKVFNQLWNDVAALLKKAEEKAK